jgi:hypothetical protein
MKRLAKLAGFTLLGGWVASAVAVILYLILSSIFADPGGSPESHMAVFYAVYLSLGLFIGSMLTGYMVRSNINSWIGLLFVSPGLYPSLAMIVVNVVMVYIVKDSSPPFPEHFVLLGVFLSWFLASWAGVWVGWRVGKRGASNNGVRS